MFKSGIFTSNLHTIRGIFESVLQIGGIIDILRGKKSFLKIRKFRKNRGGVQNFSERGGNLKRGGKFRKLGVQSRCILCSESESLLFTECQDLISFKSYYNFKFENMVGSLINIWTNMKFSESSRSPLILVQDG